MKKFLLVLSVLLSGTAFSQTYLPMLDTENVWGVDISWSNISGGGGTQSYDNIAITGTIEINGITYQVIEGADFPCYYREENGLVYKYSEWNDTEYVIYDFTLELGEFFTVPTIIVEDDLCPFGFTNLGLMTTPWEVVNVYTDFIAGTDRKVIEFDSDGTSIPEIWIEGVGSSRGLMPGGDSFHESTKLVCFTRNGTTTFFNGVSSCDNTTLSLGDEYLDQIIIYPNPVQSKSVLQLPKEFEIDEIRIISVSGKIVREVEIDRDYYIIDAMRLRSGFYFYQVLSEGAVIKTDRFIVK
jgi:hypothetical protein